MKWAPFFGPKKVYVKLDSSSSSVAVVVDVVSLDGRGEMDAVPAPFISA